MCRGFGGTGGQKCKKQLGDADNKVQSLQNLSKQTETQLGLKVSARTSSPLQLNSSMSCFVTSFIFRVTWLLCQKHHYNKYTLGQIVKWHSEFLNKNTLYHSAQMEPPAQQDPVAPSNQRHTTPKPTDSSCQVGVQILFRICKLLPPYIVFTPVDFQCLFFSYLGSLLQKNATFS